MLDRLPVLINPVSFSEKGKRLVGVIKISELTRLSDVLFDNTGEVEVDFSFDKEGRVPVIDGDIKAILMLKCQACLEKLEWTVNKPIKLGIVLTLEQADRLDSDREPLILEEEKILLANLVEDELLLALPDFPRHNENCVSDQVNEATTVDEPKIDSNNPFSVLAKLKNIGD
jgi:uncharacterized protein